MVQQWRVGRVRRRGGDAATRQNHLSAMTWRAWTPKTALRWRAWMMKPATAAMMKMKRVKRVNGTMTLSKRVAGRRMTVRKRVAGRRCSQGVATKCEPTDAPTDAPTMGFVM
jgi:hypothetical protein